MVKRPNAAVTILVGMGVGIVLGYMVFVNFPDRKTAAETAGYISLFSDVFLRLIKMLIGALVFSTLVVGIAHMGSAASVGRVFAKALGWFITASLISLLLGLVFANLLQPGKDLGLPLPDIGASANLATAKFTVKDFVTHVVPRSFAEAMANNEILQIVALSMFFGVALASMGEKGTTLLNAIDELSHVMLKITGYVMKLAPVAVCAAMAATVAVNGLEILLRFAVFMGDFYLARVPRRDRGDAQPVQHPGSRAAPDSRRGHVPRHGPLGDQCHRQLDRERRRGEVGRRAHVAHGCRGERRAARYERGATRMRRRP